MGIAPAEAADNNNGTVAATTEAKGPMDQDPEAEKCRMTMGFFTACHKSTAFGVYRAG